MVNEKDLKHSAMSALNRARSIRVAVEERERVHCTAPSNSVDDVLARLRANAKARATVRGEEW